MSTPHFSLTCTLALLLVAFAGCLGSDDAPEATASNNKPQALVQGTPKSEKFSLDDPVDFKPKMTVKREEKVTEPDFPQSLIREPTVEWRLNWTVTQVVDLSVEGKVGEIAYQVWLGKDDTQDEGKVLWEKSSDGQKAAVDGSFSGWTTWDDEWGTYTAVRLTVESIDDTIAELVLMEHTELEEKVQGEWEVTDLAPLRPSFGDGRFQPQGNGKVNMTIQGFDLPEVQGGYQAFLRNRDGDHSLGFLEEDRLISGLSVKTQISESLMASTWTLYVSFESTAEGAPEAPSKFKVLIGKFS